jgi:thiamine biosynthesis protein ThiI
MMVRVAERIAINEKANALVTGESLGQVASQTLRNIRVVNNVAKLPILRPLVGSDKEEIIDVARKIETYDICKEPYDDCCSFLTPRNPETWADPAAIAEAEAQFDVNDWIDKLLVKTEKVEFKFPT